MFLSYGPCSLVGVSDESALKAGGLSGVFHAIERGVRGGTNVFESSGLIAHAVGAASVRDWSRAKGCYGSRETIIEDKAVAVVTIACH